MGHIFISYSHKDQDYVHRLQQTLQAEGFDAWVDDRIDYGEEWPLEIEARLDTCDAFIVVVSDNAKKSKWVQNEVRRAERIKKPIFPLLLHGEPWLFIETIQWVDVQDKSMPDEKFFRGLSKHARRNKSVGTDVLPAHPAEAKPSEPAVTPKPKPTYALPERENVVPQNNRRVIKPTYIAIGVAVLLCLGFGINYLINYKPTPSIVKVSKSPISESPELTATSKAIVNLPMHTNTPELPTATENLDLDIGSTMISDKDGMTMLYVPAGEFTMGSDADDALLECEKHRSDCDRNWFTDEEPPHAVYLDAFWIDLTEVTNATYKLCVDAGGCNPPNDLKYYNDSNYANHPVVYVDYNQAAGYCEWAGRRLPTEAEWEKAARGTDGRPYPWGFKDPGADLLNYNGRVGRTTKVGSYENGRSFYGAYDMAGNVWEWVNDRYGENYYASSPSSNPAGPDSGGSFVLRGGSWNDLASSVRSSDRYRYFPAYSDDDFGFRCARSR